MSRWSDPMTKTPVEGARRPEEGAAEEARELGAAKKAVSSSSSSSVAPTAASLADDLDEPSSLPSRGSRRPAMRGAEPPPTSPRTSGAGPFSVFTAQRNLKFIRGISPIALKYVRMRMRTKKFRERTKRVDPDTYYEQKNAMWDGLHENAAGDVRRLFEKMGGMYNKLAQDWATRDGLLPKAWCRELQGTFSHFEPRPWPVIERVLLDGLADLPAPVSPSSKAQSTVISDYFLSVDEVALAAASIGQVHCARLHDGRGCVVKVIFPDIRKSINSDLATARYVSKQIVKIINLPVKDTINVIMDEFARNFPQELDFLNEVRYLKRARALIAKHGLDIYAPEPYEALCSTSVLTQEKLEATTISNVLAHEPTAELKHRAHDAALKVAAAIGKMMFAEAFFHADPHPGNIMLMDDGRVGLIDFGQCVELDDESLRMLCHIVMLLRTRNKLLITEAINSHPEFGFNTADRDLQMALIHFFFDTSASGAGLVPKRALDELEDMMQHNPKAMPVMTNIPSSLVFYGRVCTTLRKSFAYVGRDESVIEMWYPHAHGALVRINGDRPDRLSSMLLMLPPDPRGVVLAMDIAQKQSLVAIDKIGQAALLYKTWANPVADRVDALRRAGPVRVFATLARVTGLLVSGALTNLTVAAAAVARAVATRIRLAERRQASRAVVPAGDDGVDQAPARLAQGLLRLAATTVAFALAFIAVFVHAFLTATAVSAQAMTRVADDAARELYNDATCAPDRQKKPPPPSPPPPPPQDESSRAGSL